MTENNLNKKIAEIEARQFKHDFQIGDSFKEIAETDEFSEEEMEAIRSEFMLFRFMTKNDYKDNSEPRFKPVMEYTDGRTFPEYSEITEERLRYYLERAEKTTNPIMRARYLDINFEYGKPENREAMLSKIVGAYIEAASQEGEGNEIDTIDCLERAFIIARDYKDKHKSVFERSVEAILEALKSFRVSNLRWCIDLIELIEYFKGDFESSTIEYALEISEEGVDYYKEQDGSFFILESFLNLKHSLENYLTPEKYNPKEAARENAQLHLEEASEQPNSLFIRQGNLLKAAQILSDAGLGTEASKLRGEAETLGSLPEFTAGFKSFSFSETIPEEVMQELFDEFLKYPEKAVLIVSSGNFFPSWSDAKKASESEKQASISDMITNITLNKDNMPVAKSPDNIKYRKTMRYYDVAVGLSAMLLSVTVLKALKQEKFKIEDILPQLEKIKIINPDTYLTVRHGFEHLFQGRYYEALMILVPQIEDLLGDLFKQRGMKRYRQKDIDLVEPRMLGSLLNDVERFYDKDLSHLMEYQLIDAGKTNLRNIAGHGGLKLNSANLETKAISVLQIYLAILVPLKEVSIVIK